MSNVKKLVCTKQDVLHNTLNVNVSQFNCGRRQCACLLAAGLAGAAVCGVVATPFISSWMPSAQSVADAASVLVDISGMHPGELRTVMWQKKPVWILRRTPAMLQSVLHPVLALRDADSHSAQQQAAATNVYRSLKPQYLILVASCTHLGCVPVSSVDGFFCPCHGSKFDWSGRVVKNSPAPTNLLVPPYKFLDAQHIVIGEV